MEKLTLLQRNFLTAFFQTYLNKDFFLSGGTALSAFYLHHRVSDDIDLFTVNQKIEFNEVASEVTKIINLLSAELINKVSSSTYLQFIIKDKRETLKIDLIKDTPIHFGKIRKERDILIDSFENIAVGKLLALYGRADAKDFVDIYFILKINRKLSFKKLFSLAKQKDTGLYEFYLAEMMTRVLEIKNLPKMNIIFNKEEMTDYFITLSDQLYQSIKPKE